jgi:hypothetical protein
LIGDRQDIERLVVERERRREEDLQLLNESGSARLW